MCCRGLEGAGSEDASPLLTLVGHEATVSSLSLTADGRLLSASWDKYVVFCARMIVLTSLFFFCFFRTVRVWSGVTCTSILKGHGHR